MKNAILLLSLLHGLCAEGCGTTRSGPSRSLFAFSYEGDTYEIVSLVVPTNGGSNFLLLRQGERVVLRAQDEDQDGTLDTLLAGTLTLENANRIYALGIAQAQARGKYKEQLSSRRYKVFRSGHTYIIQTYLLDSGASYNKFILIDDITGTKTIVQDTDADGILDEIEGGKGDLEASQKAYAVVLKEGIRKGRIVFVDERYVVKSQVKQRPL